MSWAPASWRCTLKDPHEALLAAPSEPHHPGRTASARQDAKEETVSFRRTDPDSSSGSQLAARVRESNRTLVRATRAYEEGELEVSLSQTTTLTLTRTRTLTPTLTRTLTTHRPASPGTGEPRRTEAAALPAMCPRLAAAGARPAGPRRLSRSEDAGRSCSGERSLVARCSHSSLSPSPSPSPSPSLSI